MPWVCVPTPSEFSFSTLSHYYFTAFTVALPNTLGYNFSTWELLQNSKIAAELNYFHLHQVALIGILLYSGVSLLSVIHFIVR